MRVVSERWRSALIVMVIGISTVLVSACGSSTPKSSAPGNTAGQSTGGTGTTGGSSSTASLGNGLAVALPPGWVTQGPWHCCLGGSGESVQNNKPGADAVVVDFAVDQAAKIPPEHPAPTGAGDALKAWATALSNDLSGAIANFQPNRPTTRTIGGSAFDQIAAQTYAGALHGTPVAGVIAVLWNSHTKHNVMAWLISSSKSKAQAALPDLQRMLASLATGK